MYYVILPWILVVGLYLLLRYVESYHRTVCRDWMKSSPHTNVSQKGESRHMTCSTWFAWELETMESTLRGTIVVVFVYLCGGYLFGR